MEINTEKEADLHYKYSHLETAWRIERDSDREPVREKDEQEPASMIRFSVN